MVEFPIPYYQRDGVQGEHPQQPFKDDFKHSQWFLKSMQNGKFTNTLLRSMQTSHPLIPCRVRLQPQCSGAPQLLLVPEGTMFLQQFFWLVQEAQTYYIDLYRWTKEIHNQQNFSSHHSPNFSHPSCLRSRSAAQKTLLVPPVLRNPGALRQLGCPDRLQTDIRLNWVMVDTCWHHFDQLWFLLASVFLQIGVPQNDLVFHPRKRQDMTIR